MKKGRSQKERPVFYHGIGKGTRTSSKKKRRLTSYKRGAKRDRKKQKGEMRRQLRFKICGKGE